MPHSQPQSQTTQNIIFFNKSRYFHLAVNLLVQILLGTPLEMVHRWWRVLWIYLAGVIAGSLGTSIFDPTVRLAGASGGVYSLITAHIATIIMVIALKTKLNKFQKKNILLELERHVVSNRTTTNFPYHHRF